MKILYTVYDVSCVCVCIIQDNGEEFIYSNNKTTDQELKAMNKYMGEEEGGAEKP